MARASAAFRVKLKRLLDHAYLGEIQDQVSSLELSAYCFQLYRSIKVHHQATCAVQ